MAAPCPNYLNEPAALCIGPEGGFTDYEVGKLEEAASVPRPPYPAGDAVPVLVSRLFDLLVTPSFVGIKQCALRVKDNQCPKISTIF